MSIGARFGCFVLLAALASSALAQEKSGGSPGGTWQDPPARGAAVGQPQPADKPAPAEPRTQRDASAATPRADRRTARRERVERRRSVAVVEPRRARVATARDRRYATRRFAAHRRELYARNLYAQQPHAYERIATRRDVGMPARYPLTSLRREGWGPLLRGSRDERIADAQARGFIVLRARTLRGPDGYLTRRYTDYDPEEE